MQKRISPQAIEIIEREFKMQTGTLVLSDCGLTEIPSQVFEMEWLTELIVTNGHESAIRTQKNTKSVGESNHISSIPEEIHRLHNLKKVRIGSFGTSPWPISNLNPLTKLDNLEEIDLSNNQITSLGSILNLNKLRVLKLNRNQIGEALNFEKADHLEVIELASNQITSLYLSGINHLHNLKILNLEQNEIGSISSLFDLPILEELNLNDNELTNVLFLQNLKSIEALYLSRNNIQDIKPLSRLTKLKILELSSNEIHDITNLSTLHNLETLGLSHNRIADLMVLTKLKNITHLFLGENEITKIEPLIHLPSLAEVYLKGNKINDCPPDVWQSNDIRQIRAFFEGMTRDQSTKKRPLKKEKNDIRSKTITEEAIEATDEPRVEEKVEVDDLKLIFVGNSGAGKTQLSKFFENAKLDKTRETTHGIRLKRWLLSGKSSSAFAPLSNKVAANIWDFGGQEYYHGTFRLFLSNYAVYVLLWEQDTNRNDIISTEVRENENEDLQHYHYKYWLDNIRHYAPTSPILIVQNKIDKDQKSRVDTLWIDDYNIFGDHYISLHEAMNKKAQQYRWSFDLFCNDLMESFKKILSDEAQQNKSVAWLRIRDAVVEVIKPSKKKSDNPFLAFLQTGKYIEIHDFEKACLSIEPALTSSELYTLPRWLHNSGLVIYFGEDEELNDKVYLDPIWVTEGIYEILNNTVRAANGIFSKKDMKPRKGFPRDTVLALMQEMEIIFEKTDEPDTYVAPQYLPDTHPVEDLYAIAAKGLQQKAYFVRLPLYFFRKVLQRIIFFYGMSENVDARYYWKKGILFEKKGTRVMLKGIMPEPDSEYGVFLIGAEPIGAYRAIQKEVFHVITEILEERELSKIAQQSIPSTQSKSTAPGENVLSDIYHRTDNWTAPFETMEVPRWLKNMEVSIDGTNYANYLALCQENRKDAIFINSNLGKRLRIHDFELLLDSKPQRPLKVFFSYSHKDSDIMDKLSVHLAPLKRLEKIEVWSDKAIQAGDEWDTAIKENLRDSDIILLLVSADFIASSYIWEKEIPLALELQKDPNERVSRVIPIYLRPFDFSGLAFTEKEIVPKNKDGHLQAISQWGNIDEACMVVAQRIREVIDSTV